MAAKARWLRRIDMCSGPETGFDSLREICNSWFVQKKDLSMPIIKLDAIAVASSDFPASVLFYELLGFRFETFRPSDKHIEAITAAGDVRLMIDDKAMLAATTGVVPMPSSHSAFAMKCGNAADVDAVVEAIAAAGHRIVKSPWDAFWGQRYAIVADPEGYMIDLFAWQ